MRILARSAGAAARPWRATAVFGGAGLLAIALTAGNVKVVAAVMPVTVSAAAQIVSDAVAVTNLRELPRLVSRNEERRTKNKEPGKKPGARSRAGGTSPDAGDARAISEQTRTIDASATLAIGPSPLSSSGWPLDAHNAAPISTIAASLPDGVDPAGESTVPSDTAPTPWSMAADGGVAIGRASRNAGVATAGFFSRFGKKVAASF
jgi:hypothetical protein